MRLPCLILAILLAAFTAQANDLQMNVKVDSSNKQVDRFLTVDRCVPLDETPILQSFLLQIGPSTGNANQTLTRSELPIRAFFDMPLSTIGIGYDPIQMRASGWVEGSGRTDTNDLRTQGFVRVDSVGGGIYYNALDRRIEVGLDVEGVDRFGRPLWYYETVGIFSVPDQTFCRFTGEQKPRIRLLVQSTSKRPNTEVVVTLGVDGPILGGSAIPQTDVQRQLLGLPPTGYSQSNDANLDRAVDAGDLVTSWPGE